MWHIRPQDIISKAGKMRFISLHGRQLSSALLSFARSKVF